MILPSSIQGGEHAMGQLYQDAMERVCKFGKPNLFVTFTCNPKWKEIIDALFPGQIAKDRPELVTRVFNLKLDALLKDIKDGVLGNVIAKIWVNEFQKRGLPHARILLILDEALRTMIQWYRSRFQTQYAILRRTKWSLRAWCTGHVV